MMEQSNLSDAARAHSVIKDTAAAILRDRGWIVYRASAHYDGGAYVFCRKADLSQGLKTRILKVSHLEIEARLHTHL
jgi:hypothetical protein